MSEHADRANVPVLVVVGLGTLLSAMAGSTVNLALPTLGRELGVSIEASRWVVQAFLLAVGTLLLPVGRCSDLFGHRRLYLWGFGVFGLGSLACGLAPSFEGLVALRVVQGVGSAAAMAAGPALLTLHTPARMRGRALGLLSTATYLGLTAGPPVGGLLVSTLGWRWTFLLNVPVALVVLAMGLKWLPTAATPPRRLPFDWAGMASLAVGLPLAMGVLGSMKQEAGGSVLLPLLGAAAVICLGLFVAVELRAPAPLLDPGLFRSRTFVGASVAAFCNYFALFGLILLVPFYLEEGMGYPPSRVGLFLTAQPLTMALVASPAGWLSDRIGNRGLGVGGMTILGVALLGVAMLGPEPHPYLLLALLALAGLGTGAFISPNSSALMGAAPRDRQGTAGSVLAMCRTLGMLAGVATASTVFRMAGGQTGSAWTSVDFLAMETAIQATALASLVAAVASGLTGPRRDRST